MSKCLENVLPTRPRRRLVRSLRKWACAELAAYFVLAVVSTWPTARFCSSALPLGTESAATVPLLNVWTVWWNADRALDLYRGYWDAPIFAPTPGTFAFSEPLPTTVVVAPLIWLGGHRVLAYNVFLLAALAANGWSTFHLLRRLRFRWLVCALGGGLVEMLPLVHGELGTLQMVPLCGIVWTIHALTVFGRRPRCRRALVLGVAFAVTYLTCAYYGLFLSLVLLASSGWLLGRQLRRGRTWGLLLGSVGVALLLIGPVLAAQLRIIRTHDLRRDQDWVTRLAADPKDYAVTPWPQKLEPAALAESRPQRYFRLGPGWLKIGLAAFGLAAGLWWRRYRVWTAFCLTMLVAAFLLSLGPKLAVGGWSPYVLLMDWYPGMAQARNVYRFAVFVQLAVVLLAALGLQAILTRFRPKRRSVLHGMATIGVGLLVMTEVLPPPQNLFPVPRLDEQRQWIGWLQSQTPADSAIACIPFSQETTVAAYEETAMWMYWGTYHRRRLVNGYSGFFPASFLETKAAMRHFPDEASVRRLQALGVTYCVVRRGALPRGSLTEEPFELLFSDDTARVDLYRTRPDAPDSFHRVPGDTALRELLDEAGEVVLAEGRENLVSTAGPKLQEAVQAVIRSASEAGDPAALTVDYPLDGTIFPPEIVPPTFLWHEPDAEADTWLIDVAFADDAEHLYVLSAGHSPAAGPIDPAAVAASNEIYRPTPYQASAKSWTPSGEVWASIKRGSTGREASIRIVGFRSAEPAKIKVLSRGRVSITTSADRVGAPIFYRDVPLAPALTEKGVIKPLAEDAVSRIGWRLRDISKTESRLLLTDVPTCTNCHSFSADGKTVGMDLDGPQGDKGAYVIAPVNRETKFRAEDVMSWNSFPDKPEGHKTVGFLSRLSPDGRYAVTTLNESVYVCNFMDYRFLQVFFPTRGILGYYDRSTGEIEALPGADDPKHVHCDAVWSPDGEHLVFARAEAKDPYPENGKLAQRANDPAETQIQYDLYRIAFRGGRGGQPEPIAGASDNGMSNTFPKVSPDGKWIVFVQCRNGQLMRPDSTLWIVPFDGGTARRMRCNTSLMNSWHSFSPNSRWLVFSSKANTPYTQMFLTHIDQEGNDSPAVLVPNSTAANRAVNIPEFVNVPYDELVSFAVPALDYYRHASRGARLRKEGKFDEAIAEFDEALKLQPELHLAHVEAAIALAQKGMLDEALARLNEALALDPHQSRTHGYAGMVLAQSGRLDEAVARFQKALQIDPYYRTAHVNLGKVSLEQGKLEQATVHFRTAVELDDQDPLGHFDLGNVLFSRQMLDEAVEQFQKTVALDPQALDAHLMLSKALVIQGDFRSAVAQLRKAMTIDANNVRPVADLAWLLAVCPQDDVRDGAEAIELARRACAVTNYRSPVLLNTLSAAYAEVGNFSEAIATAKRALNLVDPKDNAQAQWIRQSLECYRAGRPCRPPAQSSGKGMK